MSDAQPIVRCKNVSIRYMVGDFKSIGLKEWALRHLTGKFEVNEFWAVRDVSFELKQGDFLAIIGTNGAGKSTLLKSVSGIMEPTKGSVVRRGSIAPFLELASGFDPDLTVRENAYLRGAMLGYTKKFLDERYNEIVAFAELKDYENRPFRQLSSGMKSRLAFSLASLVDPDILILDEVLSVGDGAFAVKSFAKMREIMSGAITILVTHSLAQVREMANRVLWLDHGRQIAFTDDVAGVCDAYAEFLKQGGEPRFDPAAIAAKRKAEAERIAAERARAAEAKRRAEEAAAEAKRKADAEAARKAAELQALKSDAERLAKIRDILKGVKV